MLGGTYGSGSAMDLGLAPKTDEERQLLLKRRKAAQMQNGMSYDAGQRVAPYMGAVTSLLNPNGNQF